MKATVFLVTVTFPPISSGSILHTSNVLFQTSMMTGNNPMMQQWMTSVTLQHVTSFQQSSGVTASHVEQYIVRGAATAAVSAPCARTAAGM